MSVKSPAKSDILDRHEHLEHVIRSAVMHLELQPEGYKGGVLSGEAREFIRLFREDLERNSEFMTTNDFNHYAKKRLRETVLKLRKLKKGDEDQEGAKKGKKGKTSETIHGPRRMVGEVKQKNITEKGAVVKQTPQNTTVTAPKPTITRGGFGKTAQTAASGEQLKPAGQAPKPLSEKERLDQRVQSLVTASKFQNARRGGSLPSRAGAPDIQAEKARERRFKGIQRDLKKGYKGDVKKAAQAEARTITEGLAKAQAEVQASLIATGKISEQKPLTNEEIAKLAAKQSHAEVNAINTGKKQIPDDIATSIQEAVKDEQEVKKNQAKQRLTGLRRTMPQPLSDAYDFEQTDVTISTRSTPLTDRPALGNINREPPAERPQMRQQARPTPQRTSNGDDDNGGHHPRRIPKRIRRGGLGKGFGGFGKAGGQVAARAAVGFFSTPAGWITIAIIVLIIIILIILFIISGEEERLKKEREAQAKLTITKTGPPTGAVNTEITYDIVAQYPGNAQDVVVRDTLPPGVEYAPKDCGAAKYDPNTRTVTWSAREILTARGQAPGGTLNGINMALKLTVRVLPEANNQNIINQAVGEVIGASGAPGAGGPVNENYAPPAPADSCGGKYASYIRRNNLLPMNYGDPQCNFDKDKLRMLIEQLEGGNQEFVNIWYVAIIPHESGFQPNAWNAPDDASQAGLDAQGAWGLYQKGSSMPPGQPPPAPGKGGPLDRGDVNWEVQTKNAIEANKAAGCDFWYYGTYRRSEYGRGGRVDRC